MKQILPFIYLLFLSSSLSVCQVEINNSIFPDEGDTLKTYIVNSVDFDVQASQTGNLNWNYTLPTSAVYREQIMEPISKSDNSSSFPQADIYSTNNGSEFFYDIGTETFSEIGVAGKDPFANLLEVSTTYDGNRILRRAPMSYSEVYSNDYSIIIPESVENLPEELKTPLSQIQADSVRLEVSFSEIEDADAYGSFQLGEENYDVLRVKKTQYINTLLYVHTSFLGWTNIPISSLPIEGLQDFPESDTLLSYQFFANNKIVPVADVTMDDSLENAVQATFIGERLSTSSTETSTTKEVLSTYPNPTYGDITFELPNVYTAGYKIEIYNIIGKKLKTIHFKGGEPKLEVNLSALKKGTYLYSLLDNNDRKLTTRRLVIITP